jgi:hypothetical protein
MADQPYTNFLKATRKVLYQQAQLKAGELRATLYVVHRPGYAQSMVKCFKETGITKDLAELLLKACRIEDDGEEEDVDGEEEDVKQIEQLIVKSLGASFEEFKAGNIFKLMLTTVKWTVIADVLTFLI